MGDEEKSQNAYPADKPVLTKVLESLPPELDLKAEAVWVGVHWTLVVGRLGGQTYGGLASTQMPVHQAHGQIDVVGAGELQRHTLRWLAGNLAASERPMETSIGWAAVNALLAAADPGYRMQEINAGELLIERGRGKRVALVGHFPFIERLREAVGTLWVLELRPTGSELPAEAAPEVMPQADVVAITGTTLLNGTFDGLIRLCRPDALVVMLGPTTPLSPVLFDYGVDVLAGARVDDPDTVLRVVGQGGNLRQMRGVRLVTMTREGAK